MKKRLVKSVFTILFLMFCSFSLFGQENCNLTLNPAPLLLKLQIGMSPEQTQAIFGKDLKIKVKKKGERTIFQNYIKKPAPNSLKGVRALYLRFFDKTLYQIEVFYEPRTDLKSVEEISSALSSQLNFPVSQWQIKNKRAEIRCGEISLIADNVLNPRIELTNEIVRAIIEEKRNKDK